MYLENLMLEVTRNCTLECEHCLRGDKQQGFMNPKVIDAVFKDVKKVGKLLLTGGEPLLAVQTLEYLVNVLKENEIQIDSIEIITNGTVLGDRLIRILRDMKKISTLDLRVSMNVFHNIEVEKRGFTKLRNDNLIKMNNAGLDFYLYGAESFGNMNEGIYNKGRAKELSSERLDEISKIAGRKYIKVPDSHSEIMRFIQISKNRVFGPVCVDVNGFLVGPEMSFEEEDQYAYDHGINVVDIPFYLAINLFSNTQSSRKGLFFI